MGWGLGNCMPYSGSPPYRSPSDKYPFNLRIQCKYLSGRISIYQLATLNDSVYADFKGQNLRKQHRGLFHALKGCIEFNLNDVGLSERSDLKVNPFQGGLISPLPSP